MGSTVQNPYEYLNASVDAGRINYMNHNGEPQPARRSTAFLMVTILLPSIGIERYMAKTHQTHKLG